MQIISIKIVPFGKPRNDENVPSARKNPEPFNQHSLVVNCHNLLYVFSQPLLHEQNATEGIFC